MPFKGVEMHTAHVYQTDLDFGSRTFKKKKKPKSKPSENKDEDASEIREKFVDIQLENVQEVTETSGSQK